MKKIFQIIKKNIVGFILGVIIAVVISSYAATQLASSSVYYNNANSGGSSNTVSGALDELYTKANTWIDPSYINFGTITTNSAKTILASYSGVCIKRNNKVSCFKVNNWAEEQNHMQEVFSDKSCDVSSSRVYCDASDFRCYVLSNGNVDCRDDSNSSDCFVRSDGYAYCV